MKIAADRAYYIKLGQGGEWEAKCLRDGITLVGPERLSRMVVDAGLSSWLREKAS